MISELDLAYIAGFVDGEGCISISKSSSRGSRNTTYGPNVDITNTNKEILLTIQKILRLGSLESQKRYSSKHKPAWNLDFKAGEAKQLLLLIRPYLRLKKRQADLLLEFLETSQHRNQFNPLTVEEAALRDVMYEEMRELNKRGSA